MSYSRRSSALLGKRDDYSRLHHTISGRSEYGTSTGDRMGKLAAMKSGNNADTASISSHQSTHNYVGFSSLPNQAYRSAVRRGVDFNVMVVGPSGSGKSTFVNTLLDAEIYGTDYCGPSARIGKTVRVDKTQILLHETTVSVRLNVIDTPGYGDAVDNTNCWSPLVEYLDRSFEEYLTSEMRVNRQTIKDSRVHCCLYFIQAGLHGLRPIDIECLKKLSTKVNVVPIVSKADTMTADELKHFKSLISSELNSNHIRTYSFPELAESVNQDGPSDGQRLFRERQPFAVVGSNCRLELPGGKSVRARRYPWGIVEVENPDHNDFLALRTLLIRTHLPHMKDVTHTTHYEAYRQEKLAATLSVPNGSLASDQDPIMKMSQEKRALNDKLRRMEAEMEQVFEMKVREKKKKLHDSEAELEQRALTMRKNQEAQAAENAEKARKFEVEQREWRQQYGHLENIALSMINNGVSPMGGKHDGEKAKKGKKFF